MVNPDSPGVLIWHASIALLIVYLEFTYAYQLAFSFIVPNYSKPFVLYLVIFHLILILDILLLFNTRFYEKGQLVQSRKTIFMHVVRSFLFKRSIAFVGIIFRAIFSYKVPDEYMPIQNLLDCIFVIKVREVFATIDKFVVVFNVS